MVTREIREQRYPPPAYTIACQQYCVYNIFHLKKPTITTTKNSFLFALTHWRLLKSYIPPVTHNWFPKSCFNNTPPLSTIENDTCTMEVQQDWRCRRWHSRCCSVTELSCLATWKWHLVSPSVSTTLICTWCASLENFTSSPAHIQPRASQLLLVSQAEIVISCDCECCVRYIGLLRQRAAARRPDTLDSNIITTTQL